ncbi:DsbA family protein [Ferrovibrio sp. MS7]|jgi:protein-disulfide isomerase|uniref:DsbA family protein n=1 Tax=Ferrovibrio plantarum TaxID=3119164 RepID=UPI001B548814|nr:DsbA family protein [Ferrovibrio sp.]
MNYIQRLAAILFFAAGLVGLGGLVTVSGVARAQSTDPRLQDMVLGKADAPVTLIEYASLTCPHCANFHASVLPVLKTEYIDTGKVKLIFRDFPLDQLALAGAAVARCAGPERYYSFLEVMFSQQRAWATAADPRAALAQIARLGGMSTEQVENCFNDQAVNDYILNSRLEGNQKFNVNSTPTLIVNGKTLAGVPSIDELRKLIDGLAANAPAGGSNASQAASAGNWFGGNSKTYIAIGIVVLVVGGIVIFLLRKR